MRVPRQELAKEFNGCRVLVILIGRLALFQEFLLLQAGGVALAVDDLHLGHGAHFELLHPLIVEVHVMPHHLIRALKVRLGALARDVEALSVKLLGVGAALAGIPAGVR